ncbi:MAG: hypothetical protein QW728_04535, partial [Thermoplasmata archaeon]
MTKEDEMKLCHKRKVTHGKTYGSIVVREFEGIDCDGAPVLEGFPSTGLVSTICASYIVDSLNLPVIGVISSH